LKTAVTGGTGCLGQALLKQLTKSGFDIQLLVLPQELGCNPVDKNTKIKIVAGDTNSIEALIELTKDCEAVFHLAGKVHSRSRSTTQANDFFRINTEGTRALIYAAAKNRVRRIVFYSTVGVYGKIADFHGDEQSPCNPLDSYAKSKYAAEQLILNSIKEKGPEGVVLRFPVAYGPLDRGNVAKLIASIYHKFFVYFGEGDCLRSMISSENTAGAAIQAALQPEAANQIFCVTDGRDVTLSELVDSICQAFDRSWRPAHIPLAIAEVAGKFGDLIEKIGHISSPMNSDQVQKLTKPLTFSCEKAKQILHYKPTGSLYEGISKEIDWLKKNRGWN
jgi:nucleoside-diphosphate-sugar epimerase